MEEDPELAAHEQALKAAAAAAAVAAAAAQHQSAQDGAYPPPATDDAQMEDGAMEAAASEEVNGQEGAVTEAIEQGEPDSSVYDQTAQAEPEGEPKVEEEERRIEETLEEVNQGQLEAEAERDQDQATSVIASTPAPRARGSTGGVGRGGTGMGGSKRRKINTCLPCKRRKVKCNRERPWCEQCRKHGIPEEQCTWSLALGGSAFDATLAETAEPEEGARQGREATREGSQPASVVGSQSGANAASVGPAYDPEQWTQAESGIGGWPNELSRAIAAASAGVQSQETAAEAQGLRDRVAALEAALTQAHRDAGFETFTSQGQSLDPLIISQARQAAEAARSRVLQTAGAEGEPSSGEAEAYTSREVEKETSPTVILYPASSASFVRQREASEALRAALVYFASSRGAHEALALIDDAQSKGLPLGITVRLARLQLERLELALERWDRSSSATLLSVDVSFVVFLLAALVTAADLCEDKAEEHQRVFGEEIAKSWPSGECSPPCRDCKAWPLLTIGSSRSPGRTLALLSWRETIDTLMLACHLEERANLNVISALLLLDAPSLSALAAPGVRPHLVKAIHLARASGMHHLSGAHHDEALWSQGSAHPSYQASHQPFDGVVLTTNDSEAYTEDGWPARRKILDLPSHSHLVRESARKLWCTLVVYDRLAGLRFEHYVSSCGESITNLPLAVSEDRLPLGNEGEESGAAALPGSDEEAPTTESASLRILFEVANLTSDESALVERWQELVAQHAEPYVRIVAGSLLISLHARSHTEAIVSEQQVWAARHALDAATSMAQLSPPLSLHHSIRSANYQSALVMCLYLATSAASQLADSEELAQLREVATRAIPLVSAPSADVKAGSPQHHSTLVRGAHLLSTLLADEASFRGLAVPELELAELDDAFPRAALESISGLAFGGAPEPPSNLALSALVVPLLELRLAGVANAMGHLTDASP